MGNLLRCHSNTNRRSRRWRWRAAADGNVEGKKGAALATAEGEAADDSYEAKTRIDDEVLVARYLHLMEATPSGGGCHGNQGGHRRRRVSFRADSFESQSSTASERRQFLAGLVDSLPETFVDDPLPPASARGRLGSWSSSGSCGADDAAAAEAAAAAASDRDSSVVFAVDDATAADTAWRPEKIAASAAVSSSSS